LSKISGLFIIARNSTFAYKGKSPDIQQVAKELGVRYVLEGSIRKASGRVRINAQLIDAATGGHLWADRYDGDLKDVFALQDEVTQKIVSALAIELSTGEQQRLSQPAPANPEAYDMLLRGLEKLRRFTQETNAEAKEFFHKAIALDPAYARAYADIALSHSLDILFGWTGAPENHLAKAFEFAKTALSLDESIPQVHFALASVYRSMLEFDKSIAAGKRSVELDPNYADGYAQLAQSLIYAGLVEEGVSAIVKAMRLNPRHPAFYVWILGHAHFMARRYDSAIVEFKKVLNRNPDFPGARRTLAASYAHQGRLEEAAWEIDEILARDPGFTLAKVRKFTPYKRTEDMENFISSLRKAGLPE
jgi:adenylate cyclase